FQPGFAQPPSGADLNGLPKRLMTLVPPFFHMPFAFRYCVPYLFVRHLAAVVCVVFGDVSFFGAGLTVVNGLLAALLPVIAFAISVHNATMLFRILRTS